LRGRFELDRLEESEKRYLKRESRPEDIETIQNYQKRLSSADQLSRSLRVSTYINSDSLTYAY
jgi:hypothetical protein